MSKIVDAKDVLCLCEVLHIILKSHNCFLSEKQRTAFNPMLHLGHVIIVTNIYLRITVLA